MSIWGKIIGAASGLAMAGPIGAILGGVAGHAYDDWRKEKRQPRGPHRFGADPTADALFAQQQVAFTTAIIVLAAKLAKADGVVSRDEIRTFKQVFNIAEAEVGDVARIYDEAKQRADGFEPYAQQIAAMFGDEPEVLAELMQGLFEIAASDGTIAAPERQYLYKVALILGFNQFDYQMFEARYRTRAQELPPSDDDAYAVLGLKPSASDQEIKSAYRRLVREHHPDTLTGKGMPEEFIAQATKTLAAINTAYDTIAKARNLK
ncbi:MAG: TerB family tellurite resistance protein [Pseudomonadota bacterium]